LWCGVGWGRRWGVRGSPFEIAEPIRLVELREAAVIDMFETELTLGYR